MSRKIRSNKAGDTFGKPKKVHSSAWANLIERMVEAKPDALIAKSTTGRGKYFLTQRGVDFIQKFLLS